MRGRPLDTSYFRFASATRCLFLSTENCRLTRIIKRRFETSDEGVELGYTEEVFEPKEPESMEFSGYDATVSLGHGRSPKDPVPVFDEGGKIVGSSVDPAVWEIYKVYEKCVIWIRRKATSS